MKTIYFIRHGQTQYNLEGRFIGSLDLPLAEYGKEYIKTIWQKKSNSIKKDIIFTSPLRRCIDTLDIIFPDEKYVVIDNLREMNFGIFEGKTHNQLENNNDYMLFRASRANYKIPDGESGREFSSRVIDGFYEMISIMDENKYKNAALICHGGTIMALFSHFCRESDNIYYYQVDNGSGYKAEYNNKNQELKIIEKL